MSALQFLMSMGFSKERSEEALIETNNAGTDIAIEWLLVTAPTGNGEENACAKACESLKEPETRAETMCKTSEASNSSEVSVKSDSNISGDTRILVRLHDGSTLSKVFSSQDKLDTVAFWIKANSKNADFGLMTNFPKKVFRGDDYKQSLEALNLTPSAVLIVTQLEEWDQFKFDHGIENYDESRKIEEKRRKQEVEKQFKELEDERLALQRVRSQIEDDKAARRLRWPHLYMNSDIPLENQLMPHQPQILPPTVTTPSKRNRSKKKLK